MAEREWTLDDAVALIAEVARPERIVLFGSHARGEARPDSDIDLLVVLPDGADVDAAAASVHRALVNRRITLPLEIVFRASTDFERRRTQFAHLCWIIDREGRPLYDAA